MKHNENGFTLFETVIAIFILTIGLLGAASAVTFALQSSTFSRNTTESKMLAAAMLEQIETLRNTGQLSFRQIANVNNIPPEAGTSFLGFPTDFVPIAGNPGSDGIFGTGDDVQSSVDPTKAQYSRKIIISWVDSNNTTLKKVDVTVRYPGFRGGFREATLTSYINDSQRASQQ